jgi:hypothetical protein
LAAIIEHPNLVAVFDHVNRGPSFARHGGIAFPHPISGLGVEAAQLAIAVHSIDVVSLEIGGADDRVQGVGDLFVLLVDELAEFELAE